MKIKKIYRFTIKPIVNIFTLRPIRKYISYKFSDIKNKKNVRNIEKALPDNSVIIFQHQFFDKEGIQCYNGGAERYINDLSKLLQLKNFTPVIIQMASHKIWKKNISNMLIIGLPSKNEKQYISAIKFFKKYKFIIYSGATKWGNKLLHPNIMISHGITWDVPNQDVNTKQIYNILKHVDNFISVDTNTISWIRATFAKKMKNYKMYYIPNYVDTTIYKPKNKHLKKRIKITFPRRASPERGYWLISAILPSIMNKFSNIDFEFIGFAHGNDINNDIKRLIQMFPNRISHRVIDANDMNKIYQNTDISIIPTLYSEGTSLSCLEAQACGNIVISTNIGGLTNLIIDGYNGILINPNSDELISALDKILQNKNLQKYLSNNAISVSTAFDKKQWISKWINMIDTIITNTK